MREILVLCLTRFGDLIQATPLLRTLRKAHPHARITLAVQKGFDPILPLMRHFDRNLIFEQGEAARQIALAPDPLIPYRHVERFVRQLEADRYDLVVNITCSRLSAYISSLVPAARVAGICVAPNGQRVINSLWGLYLFSFLYGDSRRHNRINLVDIFTRHGGVMPDGQPVELHETPDGEAFADNFIRRHALETAPLVGIQLGASEGNRCWPLENFARLADQVQERLGARIVLFGTAKELPLAEQAMALMRHRPVNAVGETTLAGLYSLLKRCNLLVTNDTGTMHFAAAAGTPVVMLCIGPAFFTCTGPYSAGNLALQPLLPCSPCRYTVNCQNPVCRTAITVEAAFAASRMLLEKSPGTPAEFRGSRLYRSRFGNDGYLSWEGVHNVEPSAEKLEHDLERMWKRSLDGAPSLAVAEPRGYFGELFRLMERGAELTTRICRAAGESPLPMELIQQLGDAEALLEAEIKLAGARTPQLAPIVDFLTMMRENMVAEGLADVALETRRVYETGKALVANL